MGAQSLAAVGSEVISTAPMIAGLLASLVGLGLLQLGVLAACTRRMHADEMHTAELLGESRGGTAGTRRGWVEGF
jgi:hypothetical protein